MVRHYELLGLPGAGKSTITRGWSGIGGVVSTRQLLHRERMRLAATHPRRVVRHLPGAVQVRLVPEPQPQAKDAAAFIARHPDLHELALAAARGVPAADERALALALLFEAWGVHGFADRVEDPPPGVLLDEGGLQRLVYLLAVAGETGASQILRPEHVGGLDGVIVLDLPHELAAERVRRRAKEFQRVELLPAMGVLTDRVIEALDAAGVPYGVVAADQPIEACRVEAEQLLAAWLRT